MTTAGWVALGMVTFGAFCYATASILQAVGARRSTSTMRTMAHPLYLAGIVFDILAWVGAILALRELAVYVVESILASSLAMTVVAARVFLKSRLRRRDVVAVVVSVAALAVLAMSAGEQHDVHPDAALKLGFAATAATIILLGWLATRLGRPGLVAVLAGLSIGCGSLAGRALTFPAAEMTGFASSALAVVTEPQVWVLVTFAVTGMVLYANALRLGQVGPVTSVLWIAEVVAPSAAAVLLLGDNVRAGWALPAALAALVMVGAAAVLATAPATEATAAESTAAAATQPELPVEAAAHAAQPALAAAETERPALPSVPQPALAAPAPTHAERVIWWGPSPIWIPPTRTLPALAMQPPVPELTWNPPRVQAAWPEPQRPDADTTEPAPAPVPRPVARRPWPEYYPPEPVPAAASPATASPATAEQPWPWNDIQPGADR